MGFFLPRHHFAGADCTQFNLMGEHVTQTPHEQNSGDNEDLDRSSIPSNNAELGSESDTTPSQQPPVAPYGSPHSTVGGQGSEYLSSALPIKTEPSAPSRIVPAQWWIGALAGLGSYVAILVLAVVFTLLSVVGIVASSSDSGMDLQQNPLFGSEDAPSPWSLLFPFAAQLPALGMLGLLSGSADVKVPMLGQIHGTASGFFMPLTITLLIVVFIFLANKFAERIAPSQSTVQKWVQAGIGGVVFTAVLNIVATAASIRQTVPQIGEISLNAANFSSIVVAFIIATAVGFWARRGLLPKSQGAPSRWSGVVRDAFLTAGVHAGTFLLVAIPVAVVVLGIKSGWAASLSSPLWAPTAGLALFGLGHLGALGQRTHMTSIGADSSTSSSEFHYAFTNGLADSGIPWWGGLLLIVLALISVAVAAIVWYLRRGPQSLTNPLSWVYLPLAFLVVGAFVVWFGSVGGSASAGSLATVEGSFGLAWWTPFLLLLWGIVTDVLSRFLAPALAPLLPARLVQLAQKGKLPAISAPNTPNTPNSQPAVAFDAVTGAPLVPQVAAPAQPQNPGLPAPAPRTPLSQKAKRNWLIGGGAALLAAILVTGGLVTVNVIRGSHGADKAVSAAFDALMAGDADKVMALSSLDIPNDQRLLMTTDIYSKATGRLDGYTVNKVTEKGDTAVVMAELRQNGSKRPIAVHLHKDNPTFLDPHWKLQNLPTSRLIVSVPDGTTKVSVNGVDVPVATTGGGSSSNVRVPALPGTYSIALPSTNKYLTSDPVTVDSDGETTATARLEVKTNDAFAKEVDSQVKAVLDQCAKSTDLRPKGCPFYSYEFYPTRNVSWKITEQPTLSISDYNSNGKWRISTEGEGAAVASYEANQSFSSSRPEWKKDTDTTRISIYGYASLDGDKVTVALNKF